MDHSPAFGIDCVTEADRWTMRGLKLVGGVETQPGGLQSTSFRDKSMLVCVAERESFGMLQIVDVYS